ncbi:MFS transporter DHA2 family multidrug resistance protein B [Legionella nautarum]|uniref:MFS transporter DHA2 family multidrug resistance protein B n=1 Tax=Legionella nautarum TaxID=45070 RepID=A0A0W0X1X4_9GAMM|nr:DHA2 family efflux MFS transporter permease subunit [Legionella nautarum]KTD38561.1 MFS transporter DHA2 family multidrug resistance protein B [Legionella nautarum]
MKQNLVLLIVSLAMFMEAVDTTIINTAIPVMATSLEVNPLNLKLALISYLLSLAIFIPISGWIADKFGIKKVFMVAVITFTLSSVWCGFTQNLWELIAARIIQGLGGSLTLPIGRLIILRTCQRHELVNKMSIVVMVASLGIMLGPVLGGVITHYFSWRWIFWVNAPVGILTLLLASKLLPFMPPCKVPPLDKIGFVLFGAGLATLTLSLSMFSESHISILQSLSIFLGAILLLLVYSWHSYKRENPIVKIELLAIRTFRISILGNLLVRMSFGGMPFLLPLLLQIGLHFSPQLSGFLLAPIALGVFVVKPFSMAILRRLGYRKLLIFNTIFIGFSLWSFSSINEESSIYEIVFLTFIYGFFVALQYTGMNSLAYANVNNNDMSAAASIMVTIQQLALSFGVAISAILLSFFSYEFSAHQQFATKIFHQTFVTLGVLTILIGLIFTRLKTEDGQEMIGVPSNS